MFGDDGVSRYPSEMVTGKIITDQGGTQYNLPSRVFRFPLVAPGDYRLVVLPPGNYSFPSQRTIADLQEHYRPRRIACSRVRSAIRPS